MSCPSRACKFLMVPGLFLSLNILLNPVCFAGFLGLLCACVGGVGGRFLMSHHNLDVFLSLCACPGTQGLCLLWETILKFGNEYH